MEVEITLEMLIAFHQERAADRFTTLARTTHMPALTATAQFHMATVRLLQTLETA
jgi:hypothetical protein